MSVTRDQARAAKQEFARRFQHDRGVTSVGLGLAADSSGPAVMVTVAQSADLARIPPWIDGVPVRALVSGAVSTL